jgi:hypothetical protein
MPTWTDVDLRAVDEVMRPLRTAPPHPRSVRMAALAAQLLIEYFAESVEQEAASQTVSDVLQQVQLLAGTVDQLCHAVEAVKTRLYNASVRAGSEEDVRGIDFMRIDIAVRDSVQSLRASGGSLEFLRQTIAWAADDPPPPPQ